MTYTIDKLEEYALLLDKENTEFRDKITAVREWYLASREAYTADWDKLKEVLES